MAALTLPSDVPGVWLVVFLLGMRHGLDADHLAATDAMTMHCNTSRPRLARACRLLFSIGHGLVVIAVALAVSVAARHWRPPAWLEVAGFDV